jgi:predicted NAD/FAD-dependent oxidoreductase
VDNQQKLAACGDWCIAGNMEAAYASGIMLARYFKERT